MTGPTALDLPVPPDAPDLDVSADAPFTREQRIWLAGYLAGARSAAARPAQEDPVGAVTQAGAAGPVHVLYGSETGNAEVVADDTVAALRARGVTVEQHELNDVEPDALAAMARVLVVCSTYGEGEMPDNAELFWRALAADAAPRLESTSFAVCALGDTGYTDFCQAGRLLDTRFEQLGATRLLSRVDCDYDYEDAADGWRAEIVELLAGDGPEAPVAPEAPEPAAVRYDRRNPFPSRLVHSRSLSGPGSAKDIRHHEFALADSGITYAAGDALHVVPCNDPALVAALLDELGHDAEHAVGDRPLHEVLAHAHEIATPSKDLLDHLAERTANAELRAVLRDDDRAAREAFLWGRDTLDLLRLGGLRFDPDEFLALLRPLQHRAYSISSSPLAAPDRVHLTVAGVRYRHDGRDRGGVCSTFLADRLDEGATAAVFVAPNTAFRPPSDDDTPMVMIGPGTGVAPFRAFLQERRARGARGRNWLLFGDQHRAHDFLYESELTGWAEDGLLTHLDLAFSRDQADKVYVQDRMREHGARLHAWLDDGAHLYVCGDATRMARDVDAALHAVVAEHGGLDAEGAAAYVDDLRRQKRYLRDVY